MSEQYIFRHSVDKDFTVLRNSLIRNKTLTFGARGLLEYLLSQPPDWETSKTDLIGQSPAGEYAIGQLLKELSGARYIFRRKARTEEGKWKWETFVFDQPIPEEIMDEIDQEMADILGPEILERTQKAREKAEKVSAENLALAAAGIGEKDPLMGYPEDVKPRLLKFISVSEIKPTKSKKAFWIKTDREWGETGIKVKDIEPMCKYAMENFGGIAGPQSITSAYHMMRTAKKPAMKGERTMRVAD